MLIVNPSIARHMTILKQFVFKIKKLLNINDLNVMIC